MPNPKRDLIVILIAILLVALTATIPQSLLAAIKIEPAPQEERSFALDFGLEGWTSYKSVVITAQGSTAGTISVNEWQTTVTGSGTQFTDWVRLDHIQLPDALWYEIDNIVSDTEITLADRYETDTETKLAGLGLGEDSDGQGVLGRATYQQYTAVANGTIDCFTVLADESGSVKVAVYSDDGSDDPATRRCYDDNAHAVIRGINYIYPSWTGNTSIVDGTKYWLAFNSSAHLVDYQFVGAGDGEWRYDTNAFGGHTWDASVSAPFDGGGDTVQVLIAVWDTEVNTGESYDIRNVGYVLEFDVNYGTGSDANTTVYCNNKCKSDFSDIRFTESDGTTLVPYYIFEHTASDDASVFVRFPYASTSGTTYYFQYGNNDPGNPAVPPLGPWDKPAAVELANVDPGHLVYDSVTEQFYMTVQRTTGATGEWEIYLANTTDIWGHSWDVSVDPIIEENNWDCRGGADLVYNSDLSKWVVYYRRAVEGTGPATSQIYAQGSSGITGPYSAAGFANPQIAPGTDRTSDEYNTSHPAVFEWDGGWAMTWFSAVGTAHAQGSAVYETHWATSTYGNESWVKGDQNPIFKGSRSAGWHDYGWSIFDHHHFLKDGVHYSTYATASDDNNFYIMMATTEDFNLFERSRNRGGVLFAEGPVNDDDDNLVERGSIIESGDYYYMMWGSWNGDDPTSSNNYDAWLTRQSIYGDSSGFPPEQVFDFYEDWSSLPDNNTWDLTGTPTVSGGTVTFNNNAEYVASHAVWGNTEKFVANAAYPVDDNDILGPIVAGANPKVQFISDSDYNDHYQAQTKTTVEENTDLGDTHTGSHEWEIRRNSLTSVTFYIDDVLVATHTTRVPTNVMHYYMGVNAGYASPFTSDWLYMIPNAIEPPTVTAWGEEVSTVRPKPVGIGPDFVI